MTFLQKNSFPPTSGQWYINIYNEKIGKEKENLIIQVDFFPMLVRILKIKYFGVICIYTLLQLTV